MKLNLNYDRYKGMGAFIAFMEFGLLNALLDSVTKEKIFFKKIGYRNLKRLE